MRTDRRRRVALAPLLLIIAILCWSQTGFAQLASPTPTAAPSPSPAATKGKTLSENIAELARRAPQLIPRLQDELESPLLDWFEKIAIVLAALIVMFSFARLWRENNGAGSDIYWWFGPLAVCFALLGRGPFLIDYANRIGKQIAGGNETTGDSIL